MRNTLMIVASSLWLISNASAFELTGGHYPSRTLDFRTGDICDGTRFPDTPGTCSGADADWVVEFETAQSRWNSATQFFTLSTSPGIGASNPGTCDPDDPSSVFFLTHVCGPDFGESTLAVARTFSFSNGESFHSDIVFNASKTWGAFDDGFLNHPGESEFRRTAVHEIGHTMGLNHPFHSDAIMHFLSQDSIIDPQTDDLGGLKSIYGAMTYLPSPDYNGNTAQELVTIRSTDAQAIRVEIRDALSKAFIRKMFFLSPDFTPVNCVMLTDLDDDGNSELAILAFRNSDGRGLVEIRNVDGLPARRRVWLSPAATPRKLVVIPDGDGNGVVELGVLMTRLSDERNFVETNNAFGPKDRDKIWLEPFTDAIDLEAVDDADGNGVPDIVVLLRRFQDNSGIVEVRNTFGPAPRHLIPSQAGVTVQDIAELEDSDNNGVPEVAVLSRRNSDQKTLVEISNLSGDPASNVVLFRSGYSARAVAGINSDADGNGELEVAVLTRRNSDGRVLVEVRNAVDQPDPTYVWFKPGVTPLPTLEMLDDVDGEGVDEASVMLYRMSDGRIKIDQRNVDTSGSIRSIWLKPE